jgi:hypothetical protein
MRPAVVGAVVEAFAETARTVLAGGRPVAVPWFGIVVADGESAGGDPATLGELLPLVVERSGLPPSTVALAVAGVTVEVERAFGRHAFVELPVVDVWTGQFGSWEPAHPVFGDERG